MITIEKIFHFTLMKIGKCLFSFYFDNKRKVVENQIGQFQ